MRLGPILNYLTKNGVEKMNKSALGRKTLDSIMEESDIPTWGEKSPEEFQSSLKEIFTPSQVSRIEVNIDDWLLDQL